MKKVLFITLMAISTMTFTMRSPEFSSPTTSSRKVTFTIAKETSGKEFPQEFSMTVFQGGIDLPDPFAVPRCYRVQLLVKRKPLPDVISEKIKVDEYKPTIPKNIRTIIKMAFEPRYKDRAKNILYLMGGWLKKMIMKIKEDTEREEREERLKARRDLNLPDIAPRLSDPPQITTLQEGKLIGKEIEFTLNIPNREFTIAIFKFSAKEIPRVSFQVRQNSALIRMTKNFLLPEKNFPQIIKGMIEEYTTPITKDDSLILEKYLKEMADAVRGPGEEEEEEGEE